MEHFNICNEWSRIDITDQVVIRQLQLSTWNEMLTFCLKPSKDHVTKCQESVPQTMDLRVSHKLDLRAT